MSKLCDVTKIKVQFRDVDSLGHVNNAVYLSYLETARVEFYDQTFGLDGFNRFPFILAEIKVRFLAPLFLKDVLFIALRVSEVGRKSFRFEYVARAESDGRVVCEAESVQVAYDYEKGRTVPLTDEWKRIVEAL